MDPSHPAARCFENVLFLANFSSKIKILLCELLRSRGVNGFWLRRGYAVSSVGP